MAKYTTPPITPDAARATDTTHQAPRKPEPHQRGLLLHATWAELGPSVYGCILWAEAETGATHRRHTTSTASDADLRPHPFAAKATELEMALPRLWSAARPGVRPRTSFERQRLTLWLPAIGVRPLPSPELVAAGWAPDPLTQDTSADEVIIADQRNQRDQQEPPGDTQLRLYRAPGMLLDAEAAGTLLAGLDHTPGAGIPAGALPEEPPLLFGADLRYWAIAAAFTQELLARQRYVPGVVELPRYDHGDMYGGYYGAASARPRVGSVWHAALGDLDVRSRFDALADAMPDLCRAALPYETPPPRPLRSGRPAANSSSPYIIQVVNGAVSFAGAIANSLGIGGPVVDSLPSADDPQATAAPNQAPAARALLESFIQTTLNARIEHWTRNVGIWLQMPDPSASDRTSFGIRGAYSSYGSYGESLTARWLRGLLAPRRALRFITDSEPQTLLTAVPRWQAGASRVNSPLFRLCFRLIPPFADDDEDADTDTDETSGQEPPTSNGAIDAGMTHTHPAPTGAADTLRLPRLIVTPTDGAISENGSNSHNGHNAATSAHAGASSDADDVDDVIDTPPEGQPWRLEYLLQARDDLSLLVPLEAVWRERGSVARFLDRRFEHPHEYALAGLGQAGRLCAPIERSLRQAHPTGCELTPAEAYAFLSEALPALEEAGFGVLAPPWWKRRNRAKPTYRLRLKGGSQTSSGLLGLDAVVSFDWRVALGDQELSAGELERLAALKAPLVRLRGQWVEVRHEEVDQALRFIREHGGERGLGEALRASLTGEVEGAGEEDVELDEVQADEWIGELLGRLRSGEGYSETAQPAALHGELRPYQRRGLAWLNFLTQYGLGACLADDMGLGKTVSFLSLMLQQQAEGRLTRPVLLVCPTSVVENWRHEAARFAPDLRVLIHHGAQRLGRANAERFAAEVHDYDLVVTTYSLLPRDIEALAVVAWGGVALDEAQNIKNAATKQSRAARRLHAPMRVALTGTPVENRLAEFWSIMDFLNGGYLGSHKRFHERFANAIERGHDADTARRLQTLIRPFVLRRVKTDPTIISDLPEKIEIKEYCPLTREQVTLYEAVVRDGMRRLEAAESPMTRRGIILGLLTRLRQVCNHPAHYLDDGSALHNRSGKLIRLEELVEELLAEGDRALIFTQFTAFGDRLRPYLAERFGVEVAYLNGGTPQPERARLIDRFQSEDGPSLFLLSLKAGGVGVNLTRANQVIHFDRWWNPAVENQATDRAFRIGQTRNVQVRKLICSGTLEERIDQLIEQKRDLAEQVIGSGEGWLTELSTAQLRDLFSLRVDALAE